MPKPPQKMTPLRREESKEKQDISHRNRKRK